MKTRLFPGSISGTGFQFEHQRKTEHSLTHCEWNSPWLKWQHKPSVAESEEQTYKKQMCEYSLGQRQQITLTTTDTSDQGKAFTATRGRCSNGWITSTHHGQHRGEGPPADVCRPTRSHLCLQTVEAVNVWDRQSVVSGQIEKCSLFLLYVLFIFSALLRISSQLRPIVPLMRTWQTQAGPTFVEYGLILLRFYFIVSDTGHTDVLSSFCRLHADWDAEVAQTKSSFKSAGYCNVSIKERNILTKNTKPLRKEEKVFCQVNVRCFRLWRPSHTWLHQRRMNFIHFSIFLFHLWTQASSRLDSVTAQSGAEERHPVVDAEMESLFLTCPQTNQTNQSCSTKSIWSPRSSSTDGILFLLNVCTC